MISHSHQTLQRPVVEPNHISAAHQTRVVDYLSPQFICQGVHRYYQMKVEVDATHEVIIYLLIVQVVHLHRGELLHYVLP